MEKNKTNNVAAFCQDIANAIMEKKGSTEPINAQNFADEIKNLPSGSSPFAVDFGEEIASGNPTFINALQEDIDYYNEVKARLASGEATDIIWNDKEFQRRIAWIPPEMLNDGGAPKAVMACSNLHIYPLKKLHSSLYNMMPFFKRLQSLKCDASEVTRLGYFLNAGYVGEVDLRFDSVTNLEGWFCQYFVADKIVLDFPILTSMLSNQLYSIYGCRYMSLDLPMLPKFAGSNIREIVDLEELHLNIPNVTSQSYSVYNNKNLRICHLKGMQCSFSITSSVLEIESVKYMLDNCQARGDGASYTLTLNAAVKTAFLAKCDEDAEYAASLASANAKGLTLA